jgi:hypothetical protein
VFAFAAPHIVCQAFFLKAQGCVPSLPTPLTLAALAPAGMASQEHATRRAIALAEQLGGKLASPPHSKEEADGLLKAYTDELLPLIKTLPQVLPGSLVRWGGRRAGSGATMAPRLLQHRAGAACSFNGCWPGTAHWLCSLLILFRPIVSCAAVPWLGWPPLPSRYRVPPPLQQQRRRPRPT